jgi:hypothetical protein
MRINGNGYFKEMDTSNLSKALLKHLEQAGHGLAFKKKENRLECTLIAH